MASQSLTSEFRIAAALNQSEFKEPLSDNYLLDVISQYNSEPRHSRFIEDSLYAIREETGTDLIALSHIMESRKEIAIHIKRLSDLDSKFLEKEKEIVDVHFNLGITEEGPFRLDCDTKREPGKINQEKFLKEHPEIWRAIRKAKIKKIIDEFEPGLGETRTAFNERQLDPEEYIFPGKPKVTGYKLELILPEKAAEVEP